MSENYNKIEEKLDNILEQLQEQQKINNSIMDVLTQVLLKDLLNDYGREIDKLITKIEYSDQLENLENYFKEYKIFIETSSILDDNMEKFLNHVGPLIQKYKNKIYIPYKVIRDIELNKNNYGISKVNKILKNISLFDIREEKEDENIMMEDIIKKVFLKHRKTYKLLLISQDKILKEKILELNRDINEEINKVEVLKINEEGFLEE
ncbi:hypothetical protein O3799_07210 [Fusobacterium periodonticum]|jgi:hypothetical protein|uniref:hypothetical protein n=1 Tax=Fusobacterium periodonticum TaxID=860 RepID=UPI00352EDD47